MFIKLVKNALWFAAVSLGPGSHLGDSNQNSMELV